MLIEQIIKQPIHAVWAKNHAVIIKYSVLSLIAMTLLAAHQAPSNPVLLDFYHIIEQLGVVIAAVSLVLSLFKIATDHNYPKDIWLDAFFYPVILCLATLTLLGYF